MSILDVVMVKLAKMYINRLLLLGEGVNGKCRERPQGTCEALGSY